jgi:chromosome segregation ATPase
VQKVVMMLQENKVKVAADLKAEEVEMAEYASYCDSETKAKAHAIELASRKIDDFDGSIEDAEAQMRAADDEIAELGTDMASKDSELASLTLNRKREHADFAKTEQEMEEAVGQLEQSVLLIKHAGAGFLQIHNRQDKKPNSKKKKDYKALVKQLSIGLSKVIDAAWVDQGSSKVLKGFLQDSMDDESGDNDLMLHKQPEEPSGSLMDTLEDLKEKAEEALSSTRKVETKASHGFQMMSQNLNNGLKLAKEKLSSLKVSRSTLTEGTGRAKGQRAETARTKQSDEKYLTTLKTECATASEEWAQRKRSADAEMDALQKAKDILTNVNVFADDSDPFLGAEDAGDDPESRGSVIRKRLVYQLKSLGHRYNNYGMLEIACAAADDPFTKVRSLIADMISKLVNEATEDASQKAFCDDAMAKSKKDQSDKSMMADKLQSRIAKATATRAALEDNAKELVTEIAELDRATAAATKLRNEEHTNNRKAYKDYKEAGKAVEAAIAELNAYYKSLAFTQKSSRTVAIGSRRQPEFGEKKADATHGVISILETSLQEYSRMAVEILSSEKESEDAFKAMMEQSKVSKAAKQAEIRAAQSEIRSLAVAMDASGDDYKMVGQELDAIGAYIDKLKPQCEAQVLNHQEKVKRREEEIAGLKEALEIIGGNDA